MVSSKSTNLSNQINKSSKISKFTNNSKISNSSTLSTSSTSSNFSNPSVIDNILSKIKNNENKKLKIYLIIIIPIIILLIFILYKYNFTSRSANAIQNMNYKDTISLTPIESCFKLNTKEQYKLCDYYICSSFMTPCVGNQHYDYVSNDMISEVLKSGARYIQIPVCESDVTIHALPIVGTAIYGQKVITSLNTLDMPTTLKTIKTNAFIINNKPVNYPLIIHLILNTDNKNTLNILSQNITDILGDVLIDSNIIISNYNNIPFYLDKLCNLLNKIIIIATPQYIGTNLEKLIMPTLKLFDILHFSEIGPLNMPNETIYSNSYNQRLSSIQQDKSINYFKKEYPSIDYILQNKDTIGEKILNDQNILNKLTYFNKLGVTVIKPLYPEDVISVNYDPSESIYYGCQISAMNFQINDVNIKNYLEIFKDSSFRLKPSSLRFSNINVPIIDFSKIYLSTANTNNNIINNFKYTNILIAFESYGLLENYLTESNTNLTFSLGTKRIQPRSHELIQPKSTIRLIESSNIKDTTNIRQYFIPRLNMSNNNNQAFTFESASKPGYFITFNSEGFNLQNISMLNNNLKDNIFYIENPKTIDNEIDKQMVSMRLADNSKPVYLTINEQKQASANLLLNINMNNNMTFIIHNSYFRYVMTIHTKTTATIPAVGASINGYSISQSKYYVVPDGEYVDIDTQIFDIYNNNFYLQNKSTKNYMNFDNTSYLLYDDKPMPTSSSYNLKFFSTIENTNYYEIITDKTLRTLILLNDNSLKFVDYDNASPSEKLMFKPDGNLFKIDIECELTDNVFRF